MNAFREAFYTSLLFSVHTFQWLACFLKDRATEWLPGRHNGEANWSMYLLWMCVERVHMPPTPLPFFTSYREGLFWCCCFIWRTAYIPSWLTRVNTLCMMYADMCDPPQCGSHSWTQCSHQDWVSLSSSPLPRSGSYPLLFDTAAI